MMATEFDTRIGVHMLNNRPTVLALDLEGTLISTAHSQIPRPGLCDFLKHCQALFPRIVIFTAVEEARFRPIARLLVENGDAPSWFADIEYIHWYGVIKDFKFIPNANVSDILLVDDFEPYVQKEQKSQWVRIENFDPPYPEVADELERVLKLLEQHVGLITKS